jgi:predicted lipid-binding transport protein (Tim44 family)
MDGSFPPLDIVLIAVAAGFILYRLAAVLGRRTGHERQRFNPYAGPKSEPREPAQAIEGEETTVPTAAAPAAPGAAPAPARAAAAGKGRRGHRISDIAPEGSPLARGLTEIQGADRNFDIDTFLAGARMAYEMIVTAFAKADRAPLKDLLGEDVYRDFESAIAAREAKGETLDQRFVGLRSAEIDSARLTGRIAQLSVRFVSEITSCLKNAEGAVIEGDPTSVHEVRDLWTFARDTRSSDPNWKLVATQSA